jgi:hypothetical protein
LDVSLKTERHVAADSKVVVIYIEIISLDKL